jgi:PadR family transcriptional regulator, regulatory protein PadR
VRRKVGQLVPLERAICDAALRWRARGEDEFHGYELAKALKADADARLLTAHGTLYRALARLEAMGLLASRWEEISSARENRPPRRLYSLTASGEAAAAHARREMRALARKRRHRWAPA